MDKADTSTNVLSEALLRELDALLDRLRDDLPRALVIRSAKDNGFCMGADITQFRDLDSREQAEQKLSDAHRSWSICPARPLP